MSTDNRRSLEDHIARLTAENQRLEARLDMLARVAAWLLVQIPDDGGLRFLSRQANEYDLSAVRQDYLDEIELLDEMRAHAALLEPLHSTPR